jgi:hypothetical protein
MNAPAARKTRKPSDPDPRLLDDRRRRVAASWAMLTDRTKRDHLAVWGTRRNYIEAGSRCFTDEELDYIREHLGEDLPGLPPVPGDLPEPEPDIRFCACCDGQLAESGGQFYCLTVGCDRGSEDLDELEREREQAQDERASGATHDQDPSFAQKGHP